MGSKPTLQSNGNEYSRRYNWFVMGLTDNALDVMTKIGRFVYYKLQPKVIYLQLGREPLWVRLMTCLSLLMELRSVLLTGNCKG